MFYSHQVSLPLKISLSTPPMVHLLISSNVIKYLGVLFDHKLSWEQHTGTRCSETVMAKGLFTKLRHYVPVTVLRNVYFGIVHSYLQYGVAFWGNAAFKYKKNPSSPKLYNQNNYKNIFLQN